MVDYEALERLARLRESGVLTDEEFYAQKQRLLSSEASTVDQRQLSSEEPRKNFLPWIIAGLLVVGVAVALWLTLKGAPEEEAPAEVPAPTSESAAVETEVCAAESTYETLKEIVFNAAVDQFTGDPVALNDLRRGVHLGMQFPVVDGFNDKVQRTDCTGRLSLGIPPGATAAFGGEKVLEADVSYSIQPAADGNGSVVKADGIDHLVTKLVAAADFVAANKLAKQGGPQLQQTFNPSFDCGKRLSNVERMICQDESLAAADRKLSERYFQLKDVATPSEWASIMASQKEFLSARSKCGDIECVSTVYDAQQARLAEANTEVDTFAQ